MEKELNHRSGQARGERKDEANSFSPEGATPPKREEDQKDPAFRRKRIRAYQRIDYWQ